MSKKQRTVPKAPSGFLKAGLGGFAQHSHGSPARAIVATMQREQPGLAQTAAKKFKPLPRGGGKL
jgi:hypothetical protein